MSELPWIDDERELFPEQMADGRTPQSFSILTQTGGPLSKREP